MINNVTLMGRLTSTPELKKTNTGKDVTMFTVAVDRDMSKDKITDFLRVTAWGGTASFITNYFAKGDMIAIVGSIQTSKYTDKDGKERTTWDIVASKVSFCGSKNANTSNIPYNEPTEVISVPSEDEEELPF